MCHGRFCVYCISLSGYNCVLICCPVYIFTVAVLVTRSHMMPALQCPAITSVPKVVVAWWVGFLFVCWQCSTHIVLFICTFCCLCLILQACQNGGDPNIFGIGSVTSAQMGDVTKSGWTFKMTYSNADKTSHVTYTFATSGKGQLSFINEDPPNTYVSCCSFFKVHLCTLPSSCIY